MRTIILIIIAVLLGKIVGNYDSNLGFNVAFFILFFTLLVPYAFVSPRNKFYRAEIEKWCLKREINSDGLEYCFFSRGKLRSKTSDVQSVFKLTSNGNLYWISCGSWWLGCISKRIRIYQETDKSLLHLEDL